MRLSVTLVGLMLLLMAMPAMARPGDLMQVADLFRFQRMTILKSVPTAATIAYSVTKVDLEANKTRTEYLDRRNPDPNDQPRQLTGSTKDRSPSAAPEPRWQANPVRIDSAPVNQLWIIDLSGGEARQLTTLSTGS